MDEPLASLDQARKDEILPYLERLRDETRIPIVYVSHSVEEVTRLADQMVVLDQGHVAAVGSPEALSRRLDLRPLTGRLDAGVVIDAEVAAHRPEDGLSEIAFVGGVLQVPALDQPVGTGVRARIEARDVALSAQRPEGLSIRNILDGRVTALQAEDGPHVAVSVAVSESVVFMARVTRPAVRALDLAPGRPVHVLVKSVALDSRHFGRLTPPG
jgi:molybdate transport system ATP-binding protein